MDRLIYTLERASTLYRSTILADAVAELDESVRLVDSTRALARAVNPSEGRTQPFSRWVRYREAYSPSLVEHILALYPIAGNSYVLDPMCGSGSTQVAAQQLGVPSLGLDVNPYAVLVSNVKTRPIGPDRAEFLREQLASAAPTTRFPSRLSSADSGLTKYFPISNLKQLAAIRSWIRRELQADSRIFDLATAALLSIVEPCSNRRKDGNGLVTRPSPVTDVWDIYRKQLELMLRDLELLPDDATPSATYHMSAFNLEAAVHLADRIFGSSLGAVIFSPPYPNSFDYFESYKLELLFGRFYTSDELQAARTNLIRNYRQSGTSEPSDEKLVELLIEEIDARIPEKEARTGVRDSRSRLLPNLLRGYFEDMKRVLSAAFEVMTSGTHMHIVVDQSAYLGVPVPTDLVLGSIARDVGFDFRDLLICRPARTSPQQLKQQPLLSETLRESVIVLTR